MKTVFSTNEIAHVWARQTQQSGKTPTRNIYFEGKEIYSYGSHFCMARILDLDTVLITDRTYSSTTSGHLSSVRYACNHFKNTIYVPYPELDSLSNNITVWQDRIKEQLSIISSDRKRQVSKDKAKCELLAIVNQIDKYCEIINVKLTANKLPYNGKEFILYYKAAKDEKASEQLATKLENNRKAIERKQAKERAAIIETQKVHLAKWLQGETIQTGWFNLIDNVYLRLVKDEIETSKGATVSVKAAKVLFDLIKSGKDIKGFHIDGYTVIGINGLLTIGCHKIERSEINRFAELMNWGTIELH